MNIALHGLEEDILNAYPKRHKPAVIRFADDVVILHHDLEQYSLAFSASRWLTVTGDGGYCPS